MPVLFVLILICDVTALTLPGASEGLKFLFHVDFSQINGAVILTALGLAFFKLSLGMGIMITYGSYFTQNNNMIATSARVALSDTLVSILAGIAIFPAVFSFGMKPSEGAGLLFKTIPLVFSKMPFGNILLVAFFLINCYCSYNSNDLQCPSSSCIFYRRKRHGQKESGITYNWHNDAHWNLGNIISSSLKCP